MSRGETKSKNSLIPSTTTAPEVSPVDFSSSSKRQTSRRRLVQGVGQSLSLSLL